MIKKLCIALSVIAGLVGLNAQEAEKLRVDVRMGYINASDVGGGLQLELEPKRTVTSDMIVGFRIAGAVFVRHDGITAYNFDLSAGFDSVTSIDSYTGTYDYCYTHKEDSPFAAFIGGGLGLYRSTSVIGPSNEEDLLDGADIHSGFGGFVRIGFDYFKFSVSLEYNMVPKGTVTFSSLENSFRADSKNSYVALGLGFYFGGGTRKRS